MTHEGLGLRTCAAWVVAVAISIGAWRCSADTIIGWQFQDRRLSYLQRAIETAGKYGVNHIHFSRHVVQPVSDFVSDAERLRELRQVVLAAKQKEMMVFVWTYEIQGVSGGTKLSLEDPAFWQSLRERYRNLYNALPGVDGLVLNMENPDLSIFDSEYVVSTLDRAGRLTKLIDEVQKICAELDWDLWVRVYAQQPEDIEWIVKGILDANPGVGVLIPVVPYRWHPAAPLNPALGRFPKRRQIVEFDLGNKNFGRSLVPYCYPEWIRDQLARSREKGVVGGIARVDCGRDHALAGVCGINLLAFNRYLIEPTASLDSVWSDFLRDTFGSSDYNSLQKCLGPTREIVEKIFLTQGSLFLSEESGIADLAGARDRLSTHGLGVWDSSYAPTERRLLTLTPKTAQSLVEEKDEAVAMCLEARALLERARAHIPINVYILLSSQLSILEDAGRLWRDLTDAYCAYQLWKRDPDERRRARLAISHTQLTSWVRYFRTVYGFAHPIFNIKRLERFAAEIAPPPPPEQQVPEPGPASRTPSGLGQRARRGPR